MDPVSEELWPGVRTEAERRLLQAGLDCFARRGYHATTTRDINAAAGLSPAALYVYFPSKMALLYAICRIGHEQALAMVSDVAAAGGGPAETMRRLVEDFVAWHARRRTRARVVQYELEALGEEEYAAILPLRRRIERHFREVIARGVESGVFHVPDVRLAARAVNSLCVDVARWYRDGGDISPEDLGKRYAELVLRMLAAGPPSAAGSAPARGGRPPAGD